MAIFDERRLAANIRATVMGSIQLNAQAALSLLPSACCAYVASERCERSTGVLGVGALSRPLARDYARNQRSPRASQNICLQSGRWTSIVAQGREYLLYCTRDEKVWTSWHVEPAARKVRGPGKLFEDIPPPDSY